MTVVVVAARGMPGVESQSLKTRSLMWMRRLMRMTEAERRVTTSTASGCILTMSLPTKHRERRVYAGNEVASPEWKERTAERRRGSEAGSWRRREHRTGGRGR